jgi:hypothetical protein
MGVGFAPAREWEEFFSIQSAQVPIAPATPYLLLILATLATFARLDGQQGASRH